MLCGGGSTSWRRVDCLRLDASDARRVDGVHRDAIDAEPNTASAPSTHNQRTPGRTDSFAHMMLWPATSTSGRLVKGTDAVITSSSV